mmetsp:Transcript_42160/g.106126  ORF Transcript_42160/g.106126 Transcript_42160/m.106126 type:complete len:218 (+) Transcript_42160:127-780(+)
MPQLFTEVLVERRQIIRVQVDVHKIHSLHDPQSVEDLVQILLGPHFEANKLTVLSPKRLAKQVIIPILDVVVRALLTRMYGTLRRVASIIEHEQHRVPAVLQQRRHVLGGHLEGAIAQHANQSLTFSQSETCTHQAAEAGADGGPITVAKHLHAHRQPALRRINHPSSVTEQHISTLEVMREHQHHSVNGEISHGRRYLHRAVIVKQRCLRSQGLYW